MLNEILEDIWKIRKEIEKEHYGYLRKVFRSMKKRYPPQKDESIMGHCAKKPYPDSAYR